MAVAARLPALSMRMTVSTFEVSLGRLLVMPYYCGLPNERLKSLDELKIENMIFLATNVYLNKLQNILPA
ncbi:MAG: hypothetical protein N2170_09475, partial [Bacteroidia bacterium]|nr:hypothetical protein [Bacteroidia bacterium]